MLLVVLAVIISFLLGSIPSGYIIGKYFYDIDVREHGSCNLGATNVMRVLGTAPGIVCLILDVLKGFVAVWFLTKLFGFTHPSMYPQLLIALGAVAGHCLCPWLGWRGGKGVATALGALWAIAPLQVSCVALIGVILIAATGYVSVGSMVGAFLFPIFVYFSSLPSSIFYVTVVLGCILIIRHRSNIERLMLGTEKHFWKSAKDNEDAPDIDDIPTDLSAADDAKEETTDNDDGDAVPTESAEEKPVDEAPAAEVADAPVDMTPAAEESAPSDEVSAEAVADEKPEDVQ